MPWNTHPAHSVAASRTLGIILTPSCVDSAIGAVSLSRREHVVSTAGATSSRIAAAADRVCLYPTPAGQGERGNGPEERAAETGGRGGHVSVARRLGGSAGRRSSA